MTIRRPITPGLIYPLACSLVALAATLLVSSRAEAFAPPTDENFNSGSLSPGWSGNGTFLGGADQYIYLAGNDFLSYSFTLATQTQLDFTFWYSTYLPGAANAPATPVFNLELGPLGVIESFSRTNTGGGIGAQSLQLIAFGLNNPGPGTLYPRDLQYQTLAPLLLDAGDHTLTFRNRPGLFSQTKFDDIQFMAVAVPEPESWALMLAGLGAFAFMSRRRRPNWPSAS